MGANKPGLADLKQLRQLAREAAKPTADNPAKNTKRRKKSRGFIPPVGAPKSIPEKPPVSSSNAVPVSSSELIDASDRALFRQVVQSVQRLPDSNRALLPPIPQAPRHVLAQRRESATGLEPAALPQVSDNYASPKLTNDPTRFLQVNYGPDLIKQLERGKWPIGASLDLHGATLDEARSRLDGFLRSCIEHQIRCVRVVHGKGHGSRDNTPVLKETVRRWLTQLEDVKAYVECSERDGGAGAVLVLLRVEESER